MSLPGEPVELADSEHIVARGAARTTWFVREGDTWTKASELAGAELEQRDPGPGTVWERLVRVSLPVGTELMRVETRPLPVAPKDPLAYLERESKRQPRATRRSYYQVLRGGRLRLLEKKVPPAPT